MKTTKNTQGGQSCARRIVDTAVINLWLALRDASDTPEDLEEADLDIMMQISRHPAIQRKLSEALDKKKG